MPFGIVQEIIFSTRTDPPAVQNFNFDELPFSFAELFFFLLKQDGKERSLPHSVWQVYGATICIYAHMHMWAPGGAVNALQVCTPRIVLTWTVVDLRHARAYG